MKKIFHIDANSAYLSWTAAAMLEKGYPIDIREIPSAISGDPLNRHGIILAKSIPAKKYGLQRAKACLKQSRNILSLPYTLRIMICICSAAMPCTAYCLNIPQLLRDTA